MANYIFHEATVSVEMFKNVSYSGEVLFMCSVKSAAVQRDFRGKAFLLDLYVS